MIQPSAWSTTSRVYRDELRSGDNLAIIEAIANTTCRCLVQIYGVVPPTFAYFNPITDKLPADWTFFLYGLWHGAREANDDSFKEKGFHKLL